ncbi:MAG: DNA-protecting protein DprA [Rickettsiales bacterium]|nr:MAG: DNA-protecting protein DprA [Rickettsiales bacterium]
MLDNLFVRNKASTYSDETIDILRLIRSENVGSRTYTLLIKKFGSARNALENIGDFSLRGGRSKPIKIFPKSSAEQELEKLRKNGAHLITHKDYNYSQLLAHIPDFPPVISYKGNISLLNSQKIIAVVGARNSSLNSRSFAYKLSKDLVDAGYVTASGLARGIDTEVHKASGAKTIAVIAGGIDHTYPPENKKLQEYIEKEGLLLAELAIGSKPLSQHFPQRNRIISGLALATIVIEASLKSGSLITARFALEQGREVFAVPGFPLDPRCMGSNKLIKDGAQLLESSEDVIANVPLYKKSLEESKTYSNNLKAPAIDDAANIASSDRENVRTLLSSMPVTYEMIADETKLSLPIIYTICLELELAGKIVRYPDNKIALLY